MLVDVFQVSAHTIIERKRELLMECRVLVGLGDSVSPMDVVAEASLPACIVTLDLCRGLGLSPEEADACAVRNPGETLNEGDLIAQCEGALTRLVRSPVEGILVEVRQGNVVIATDAIHRQALAGMTGVVVDVVPATGILLRAEGSLVQGVWGTGGVAGGKLHVVEVDDGQNWIDEALEPGEILAVPAVMDDAAFDQIIQTDPAGLICGTLSGGLLSRAVQWGKPMFVLQGFETQPVDPVAWELLTALEGSEAGVNAQPTDPLLGRRPEIVIPNLEGTSERALGFRAAMKVGQRARVLSGPAIGRTGQVDQLKPEGHFESSLPCPAVVVHLKEGDRLTLPAQNVAILG